MPARATRRLAVNVRAMGRAVEGHAWTVAPHVWHALRPARIEPDEPWAHTLTDARMGAVRVTGRLRTRGQGALVVIVHGLGGDDRSRYMLRTAAAAASLGHSYLRLNLRGAEGSGEDVYHAGLSSDLRAVLASPALAGFSDIVLIGWSLGGHLVLRWASEADRDPRVRGVVSVCAPLDLGRGVRAIQRPFGRPYQWHVLRALKAKYAHVASRRPVLLSAREAERIETLPEWDERIVAPRFGFRSADHYYAEASVGPLLDRVELPALFVAARHDPMVTANELRRWLPRASQQVRTVWAGRGGHVAFPEDLDLGLGHAGAIEPQLVRWALSV